MGVALFVFRAIQQVFLGIVAICEQHTLLIKQTFWITIRFIRLLTLSNGH